jgi:ammonia channel protein AmtB
MVICQLEKGKLSALGMVSGAIAGFLAITPAAGYINNMSAAAIGAFLRACYVMLSCSFASPRDWTRAVMLGRSLEQAFYGAQ